MGDIGAYAEYIAVSTRMLIHKPAQLSWIQAAGIPETWITASQALFLVGCFHAADAVLFHAGASAVSIAGIQLAVFSGASAVFTTAGSDEKVAFCEQLGATKGFNYKTQDWAKGVLEATGGRGVDVIVDFIGKDYAIKNFEVAAIDGRIVQLASLSGSILPAGLDVGILERKRLRWERLFDWKEVRRAHELMESNQSKGKIICTVDAAGVADG
jgi:NADPH:quinone reductase-like Zn-dependent oxidoreductase